MIEEAIAREKQLKTWSRIRKVQLIVENNPVWRDLSVDWGTLIVTSEEVIEPKQ